jgi:hypothetical protein
MSEREKAAFDAMDERARMRDAPNCSYCHKPLPAVKPPDVRGKFCSWGCQEQYDKIAQDAKDAEMDRDERIA